MQECWPFVLFSSKEKRSVSPEPSFVDFYELLQISPNAEQETIQRVFKMLAARYHPDNPETGDVDRFLLLNRAYEVLADAESRLSYDALYERNTSQPISLFETKEFAIGVDGEANRRMGLLCLLYKRRRSNPDDPGLSILEFESLMSYAREHLMFTIWYLKELDCIRQDESSDYVITGAGVDYVESHLPSHRMLYRLLKSAESGSTSDPAQDDGLKNENS
jgi:curved DNA-binding protein